MKDWPVRRLKAVCRRITVGHVGPMKDEYVSSGIPFLRSQNVQPFRIATEDIKFISEEFHNRLIKSALHPGDVVIVRTGYPGTSAVLPKNLKSANCADLVVITTGPEMNPVFLECLFNSIWGRGRVAGNLVGVAQQHFNIASARELEVPVPPRAEQDKIVHILSRYNDLLENNINRIKILEEMAQLLFREWFVNFRFPGHAGSVGSSLPKGWSVRELGELCELRRDRFRDEDKDLPLIDMARMPQHSLAIDETGRPEELTTSRITFEKDDLLFGSIRAYLHKVCLAPSRGVTNISVFVIRPNTEDMKAFLPVLLSSSETIRWADQHSTGTKMPVIKWELLQKMPVFVPRKDILEHFRTLVQPMLQFIQYASLSNRIIRQTRDLLLPKLISGQLDVTDLDIKTNEDME